MEKLTKIIYTQILESLSSGVKTHKDYDDFIDAVSRTNGSHSEIKKHEFKDDNSHIRALNPSYSHDNPDNEHLGDDRVNPHQQVTLSTDKEKIPYKIHSSYLETHKNGNKNVFHVLKNVRTGELRTADADAVNL